MFKTIIKNSIAEIVEKKSKFIANLFYVETIEDAEEIIKQTRKKYYDARHNCFAYRIINDDKIVERFSDDGEPSGTAGAPMLAILQGRELSNVLVIVTRYFGGILLGTGGLVRAYSDSAVKAIEENDIVNIDTGFLVKLNVSYQEAEKIKYYINKNEIIINKIEYSDITTIYIEITEEKLNKIQKEIDEKNLNINNLEIIEKMLIHLK